MKKIHHFKNFSVVESGIEIKIDMSRMEHNFNNAQKALDSAIMTSMEPLMPLNGPGNFISRTKAESASLAGTGVVVAAAGPYGRFLYEGKTMVDEKTGSPWARQSANKVLVSQYRGKTQAKENLTYSRASAQAHWFDAAKAKDCDNWVGLVKKEIGK